MSQLPSLYNLTSEYLALQETLADMELDDQTIADTLEGMAGTLEVKVVNVAMFAKNLDATVEAIKQAEAAMTARRKTIENRGDKVREYIKDNMERAGIKKIECPYFALTIKKNPPSVKVEKADEIPAEYKRTPPPPEAVPDKTKIGVALKAGTSVAGAYLETESTRLEIK